MPSTAMRFLSTRVHGVLVSLEGARLAVFPWLFGFDREVWAQRTALGLFRIAAVTLTDTIPGYEHRRGDAASPTP